jgi:hypothetical protein
VDKKGVVLKAVQRSKIVGDSKKPLTSVNTAFTLRADALGLPEEFQGSGIKQTTLRG